MPRTKVAKSSKRNREAAIREEKIRDFDASLDQFLCFMEQKGQSYISAIEGDLRMLIQRTPKTVLRMNMGEFMALNLAKFNDWTPAIACGNSSQLLHSACSIRSVKPSSSKDEGYLTEESNDNRSSASNGSVLGTGHSRTQQRGRTPGPLSSARARRVRRSRSACEEFGPPSALKPKATAVTEHSSRKKLRTPAMRSKALSADRSQPATAMAVSPPSSAFMRWPKPGELVVSTSGTPIVAQVMPDKYANVNIPIRNGMLSLRPKKLTCVEADLIQSIDVEHLNQIKILQANLNMIVKSADMAAMN